MLYQFDSPELKILTIERAAVCGNAHATGFLQLYAGLKYSLATGDLSLNLKSRRRGKFSRHEKRTALRIMREDLAYVLRDKLRALRESHFLAEIPLKNLRAALDSAANES